MNKIEKFLKKLSPTEGKEMQEIISRIVGGKYENIDMQKMSGYVSRYRVRKGRIRIIFTLHDYGAVIEKVDFRNDHTY